MAPAPPLPPLESSEETTNGVPSPELVEILSELLGIVLADVGELKLALDQRYATLPRGSMSEAEAGRLLVFALELERDGNWLAEEARAIRARGLDLFHDDHSAVRPGYYERLAAWHAGWSDDIRDRQAEARS